MLQNIDLTRYIQDAGFDASRYGTAAEDGYYPYIAEYNYRGIAAIINKYARKDDDFVDVGSGIGDKLYLAWLTGKFRSISGIEVNPETYYVSKYLLSAHRRINGHMPYDRGGNSSTFNIHLVDALTVDYSAYSFIYMYHPIQNEKIYSKLIKRIKETTKDDTIVVEMLHHNLEGVSIVRGHQERVLVAKKVNGNFEALDIPKGFQLY